MQSSKVLISQALNIIQDNLERTGDPLGVKTVYWTRWSDGLSLPDRGPVLLYTARMYQMLPFIVEVAGMTEKARPLLPLLSVKGFARIAEVVSALTIDPLLRVKARRGQNIRSRSKAALCGIVSGLAGVGVHPAYLHDNEPYSGVLLWELELEEKVMPVAGSVYNKLKSAGAETVVTVDPHTTFMLREVYPRIISNFNLDIRHYLELLAELQFPSPEYRPSGFPEKFVLHDSCVMTRNLGIIEAVRTVANRLNIEVIEPENTGMDTACCGGPVEYAYPDLSRSISYIRAKELAETGRDVLVLCPVCLINLMKHENELGIRVWDMGEILNSVFSV
ncbi:MAG: (Fe-S)-binding protein [Desulfobacteraceae bacterium]|nr:(Fe-S)-binding protein [Desulfobacteraceae bacterium]